MMNQTESHAVPSKGFVRASSSIGRMLALAAFAGMVLVGQAFAFSGPELRSVTLDPQVVLGGGTSTGTVSLTEAAPTGGETITLASNNAAASVPASVSIAAGSTSATFTVTTTSVGTRTFAQISGTLANRTRNASLEIQTLLVQSLSVSPTSVTGGTSSTGMVTLNGAAPTGGAVVNLVSSSASASVPASVSIAAGSSSATFAIATTSVTAQDKAKITATLGNKSESTILLVEPTTTFSVALSSSSVAGGALVKGTVTLGSEAPTGGIVVLLSSSNPAAAVQSSVKIPGGKSTGNFGIFTSGVATSTAVTITASVGGVSETATLTVTPPALAALALATTNIASGDSTSGIVTLSGPAPKGGIVVNLSSSSSTVSVPASVTVNQGRMVAEFKVTTQTVTKAATAVISATSGSVTETASLTVAPLSLASVAVRPNSVDGGNSTIGTVTLNGAAGSGGVVVTLASSDPSATVPTTFTVAQGKKEANFKITTTAVTLQTSVTITASVGSDSQTATLIVNAASLIGLRLNPARVTGGGTSTGTVRLSGPAPTGGIVITLASNSASATVPTTVTVPAGQNSVSFTVQTASVTAKTLVQVSATLGTQTNTANLTITAS